MKNIEDNFEQQTETQGTQSILARFDIKGFLQKLWKSKYWILLSIIVCSAIAIVKVSREAPIYGATAEFMLLNSNGGGTSGNGISSLMDLGISQGEVNMNNEMQMMISPYIMEGVVKKLNLNILYTTPDIGHLKDLYGISPVLVDFHDISNDSTASIKIQKIDNNRVKVSEFVRNNIKSGSNALIVPLGTTVNSPVGKLTIAATTHYGEFPDEITVSKSTITDAANIFSSEVMAIPSMAGTSIIKLTITDKSQQRGVDILNTLIKVYDEAWINEKNKSAINSSNFIKERLSVIEKELSGIDENISQAKSANAVTDFETAASTYYNQSSTYDTQEYEMSTQLSIAQFLRDYLRDPGNANGLIPSNLGISNGAIENQIQEYNRMIMKRDNLLQNSSAANPVIAELNSNIATMRQMITRSVDNMITTIRYKVKAAGDRGRLFSGKVSAMPEQQKQLLSIERQQKVKENLYLFLLQKREENELSSMITVNNTRTVRIAAAMGKLAPDKTTALTTGAAIGLSIPIIIIILITLLNTKVNSRADISSLTIPYIGEIPLSRKRSKKKFSFYRLIHPQSRKIDDNELEIVVKERSRNHINEAFRMIRTNLDFLNVGKNGDSKVIMLTSFNPGSGKTFITMNLAKTLSLKGEKVLIIDLDLRRASMSKYLGSPVQGISAYLSGKVSDASALITNPSNEKSINILPVGALPPNPAELLLDSNFDRLIEELRQKYDYILLDCPPLDIVADTAISARVADLTIFIIRAGLFDKSLINDLEDVYKEGKLPHMSIILNGIDITRSNYGYRYGYGYGYGYGYRSHNDYYTEEENDDNK